MPIGSLLPLSSSSMGRRLCFRFIFCERRMANTEAESVDDMVDASKREVINGRWMLVQLMPDSHQINNPVKRAVSSTPAVDKTMPGVNMGFISVNLVSMPPENRMMLSATMPMNCASLALWNCNPNPSLPNSIPTTRKSNNAGTPKR